jgi:hypothetical protein
MQETTTTYSIILDTFYWAVVLLFLIGIISELRYLTRSKRAKNN